jgi:hypothetical protein
MGNSGQKMEQTGDVIEERAKRRDKAESDMRASIARQLAAIPLGTPIPEVVASIKSSRRVQDPMLTDANYYAERAKRPQDPNVGRVWAEENVATRIGGLALIRRKLNHHEKAAEWFKNAYEALYGGGMAPSVDLGKVRVDTSIMAHDNGAVARLDQGKTLQTVMDALGKPASDRIVACVVLGIPCADSAPPGPSGKPSGHAVQREVDLLLAALDHVAELRQWKMRGAA